MSLHAALNLFLEEYPRATSEQFAGNSVATFVRDDVPKILEDQISNPRYIVHGSAGQGNWARVPWVAVFDTLVTDTAQDGFYIVYLVKEDFTGVFLSLNQGVTTVKERYGADAKKALEARAKDFVARLGKLPAGFTDGAIDLASRSSSSLGSYYEAGSICSRYYAATSIPTDGELLQDLTILLDSYLVLADRELPSSKAAEREDDEADFEDLSKIRMHKRIERNQRLAQKVKKLKGLTCEACGFSYSKGYFGLNTDYIEAHHLTPLSELSGSKIKLNPKDDFAVLCADCHRMIHRSEFIQDVKNFRLHHVTPLAAQPGGY